MSESESCSPKSSPVSSRLTLSDEVQSSPRPEENETRDGNGGKKATLDPPCDQKSFSQPSSSVEINKNNPEDDSTSNATSILSEPLTDFSSPGADQSSSDRSGNKSSDSGTAGVTVQQPKHLQSSNSSSTSGHEDIALSLPTDQLMQSKESSGGELLKKRKFPNLLRRKSSTSTLESSLKQSRSTGVTPPASGRPIKRSLQNDSVLPTSSSVNPPEGGDSAATDVSSDKTQLSCLDPLNGRNQAPGNFITRGQKYLLHNAIMIANWLIRLGTRSDNGESTTTTPDTIQKPKVVIAWPKFFYNGLRGYSFLLTILLASSSFIYVQPFWNKYNGEFVTREYNISKATCGSDNLCYCPCLYSNDTSLLTQKNVNRFVNILHSIILNEGCRKDLYYFDSFNFVATIEEYRPVIPDEIIFDDLIRIYNYTTQEADLLIKTCRSLFAMSHHDVTIARKNGFIYANDSLMKYCGYKINFMEDIEIFGLLFIVMYALIAALRFKSLYVPNKKEKFFEICEYVKNCFLCKRCKNEQWSRPRRQHVA